MSGGDYEPPPWLARLILGVFVVMLVLTAVGLALFVRVGG